MDTSKVTFRLIQNIQKVLLDHGDEIAYIKRNLKEIKGYFSPKMLIIYFGFILAQVIGVTFWVAKQQTTIELLTKEVDYLREQVKDMK
jgi:cell division protein FtsB